MVQVDKGTERVRSGRPGRGSATRSTGRSAAEDGGPWLGDHDSKPARKGHRPTREWDRRGETNDGVVSTIPRKGGNDTENVSRIQ